MRFVMFGKPLAAYYMLHSAKFSASAATLAVRRATGSRIKACDLPIETDPEKLVKFCCGANINKDGTDPELMEDSAYPDWLWDLRTERRQLTLDELDPDTREYWKRYFRLCRLERFQLLKKKYSAGVRVDTSAIYEMWQGLPSPSSKYNRKSKSATGR